MVNELFLVHKHHTPLSIGQSLGANLSSSTQSGSKQKMTTH